MKKSFKIMITMILMTVVIPGTIAYAGTWKQDSIGWWWQEDNGSYPVNEWQWIDGNGDGTAECYCFDGRGYLYCNTTTPDGYQVNKDGAWVKDEIVQTKTNFASKGIASYKIVRDERDKHGYDVDVYFERPVFEETTPGYRLINEFFEQQSNQFFSNENTDLNTLWEIAEEFSSYDSDVSDYGMECFVTAEVTYQSEKLVSVLLFRTRCYGGSDYSWDEGYLFYADTGKRVKLREIIDGTEEEIKSMIEQVICDKYGDDGRIHSTIAAYPFDGLNFYVKEGKVHITFAKYEILSGAAGIIDVTIPANLKFQ